MLSTAEKWYSDSQTKLKPHAEKEKRARAMGGTMRPDFFTNTSM